MILNLIICLKRIKRIFSITMKNKNEVKHNLGFYDLNIDEKKIFFKRKRKKTKTLKEKKIENRKKNIFSIIKSIIIDKFKIM